MMLWQLFEKMQQFEPSGYSGYFELVREDYKLRLINADALLDAVREDMKDAGFYRPIYEGFVKKIDESPTADAAPVLHSNWVGALRDALEKQPKWISVKERLPEKAGRYLVCAVNRYGGDRQITAAYYQFGARFHLVDLYEVTHWMPLPEPPKEDNHENA